MSKQPKSELLDRTPPHDLEAERAVWPKDITLWQIGEVGYMSIPFTWLLPKAQWLIDQGDLFIRQWIVGGPATCLMPTYLRGCTIGTDSPGILQRINPHATRTTVGCIRRCRFCGVRTIEGDFHELDDWPDCPILCDNNLLAASDTHFDRVIDRLVVWGWCDFNQGLDARLLTAHYAKRIAEISRPMVRLALDCDADRNDWRLAVAMLRNVGVAKSRIRTYVLCGFEGSPEVDWQRCEFVESLGVLALPMWFHPLDALKVNAVTPVQAAMGWTHEKRRQLMRWYYKHSGTKLIA